MPEIEAGEVASLYEFVGVLLQGVTPLSPEVDCSLEPWLARGTYTLAEQREIRTAVEAWDGTWSRQVLQYAGFAKDEGYDDWKHVRLINGPSSVVKGVCGPIFSAIETQVYQMEWFIKHVPVLQRAKWLFEKLNRGTGGYVATDFSRFEASFVRLLLVVEIMLYVHMMGQHPLRDLFFKWIFAVLSGWHEISVSRLLEILLAFKRMSGDMCTSLGNGWCNAVVFIFLCRRAGDSDAVCAVEGDDLAGNTKAHLDAGMYRRLGLEVKLELHANLEDVGFCGMYFSHDHNMIVDPLRHLANAGLGSGRYLGANSRTLRGLARVKGICFVHQFHGMPILHALARYLIRSTENHISLRRLMRHKGTGWWERNIFLEAIRVVPNTRLQLMAEYPTMDQRLAVEARFGVSVPRQLELEAYLDSMSQLCELRVDQDMFPLAWADYARLYLMPVVPGRSGRGAVLTCTELA